jgi:hypothetical protein
MHDSKRHRTAMREAVPEAELVFSDNDSGYSSDNDPEEASSKEEVHARERHAPWAV